MCIRDRLIPGFEDQIIGHKIGDKFDVNVKFPEDYQADLASKDLPGERQRTITC